MFSKKSLATIAVILLVLLSACGPGAVSGEPTADTRNLIQTAFQETHSVETGVAQGVAQTLTAMVAQAPQVTQTPQFTQVFQFTLTPVLMSTLTLEGVRLSVSTETNCRQGPGTAYDKLGVLPKGQEAQAVGRSAASDFWIIQLPSNPAITCWLWGQYATVSGDPQSLAVFTPPPTPTPVSTATPTLTTTPGSTFSLAYVDMQVCPAAYWSFNLLIKNTGATTWESNRVWITNETTAETEDIVRNDFPRADACAIAGSDGNLAPGEVGYTNQALTHAPAATDTIKATVRVCSEDDLGGTCVEKTITFKP